MPFYMLSVVGPLDELLSICKEAGDLRASMYSLRSFLIDTEVFAGMHAISVCARQLLQTGGSTFIIL
jgi:enamine deaminase RidA (YjgF/YER057c/UK114 family)